MSETTERIMADAEARAYVEQFVTVHTWAPRAHARYLVQVNAERAIPFCWECADWHHGWEQHSQA